MSFLLLLYRHSVVKNNKIFEADIRANRRADRQAGCRVGRQTNVHIDRQTDKIVQCHVHVENKVKVQQYLSRSV